MVWYGLKHSFGGDCIIIFCLVVTGTWSLFNFIFPNSWDDDPIWRTHIFSEGLKPPTSISLSQWPFQEPIDWRYLPGTFGATSILGSWNYHWLSSVQNLWLMVSWGIFFNYQERGISMNQHEWWVVWLPFPVMGGLWHCFTHMTQFGIDIFSAALNLILLAFLLRRQVVGKSCANVWSWWWISLKGWCGTWI